MQNTEPQDNEILTHIEHVSDELTIAIFKSFTEFGTNLENFNFWFLTVIAATAGLLLNHPGNDLLMIHPKFYKVIFGLLLLSFIIGMLAKYHFFIAKSARLSADSVDQDYLIRKFGQVPQDHFPHLLNQFILKTINGIFPFSFIRRRIFQWVQRRALIKPNLLKYQFSARHTFYGSVLVFFQIATYVISLLATLISLC